MHSQKQKLSYSPRYLNGKGKYQKDMEELRSKLIPEMGKSETMHGELLRCISKIYYDVFNNGFCNSDVLQYQVLFVLNFKDELENVGLSKKDSSMVKNVLNNPPKRTHIWEDDDFTKSLDHFVDACVLYCKTK